MAETKKSRNDQGGSSKLVIKLGGGGVVGVVVLLGGALATAAFVLGQKRRSSGKDNRRRSSSPELDGKSEKEHEHTRKGGKAEVEMENDSTVMISAHSLKVDVEAISDDGFVIVKPSSEIPLLAKKEEIDKVFSYDYLNESTNHEQVYIEDESAERESHCDGEIAAEVTEREEDNGVEEDQIEDKHLKMEVKEKECVVVCNGNGEINEEKTVNGCIVHQSPENILNVEKEEVISPEDVEAPQKVELNENGALVQHHNSHPDEDDAKRANEEKVEDLLLDHGDGKATMSNVANLRVPSKVGVVVDYGVDRRGKSSKWEALWQAERPKVSPVAPQRVKLMSYEVGGKVREDEAVINKYAMEMVKEDQASSTRLKMMVWALSMLSSLSCSWFFDLSVAKLCLVVFLTLFLLEIYGYSLINCQQAAKGESEKLGDM